MALTVFETTEQQLLPCQQAVEQGAGDAAAAGAEKATVTLKETDRGPTGGSVAAALRGGRERRVEIESREHRRRRTESQDAGGSECVRLGLGFGGAGRTRFI
jgi:hypothetical protein